MSNVRIFENFLTRVHRRFVITRIAEWGGLGLLAGCGVAVPLLAIAMWRGLPLVSLAAAALGLGTAAGSFWGLVSRPTRLASAMETDRQLGWPDLLASAYAVRKSTDPWVAAVMVDADRHCQASSPSAVLLNRFGMRAWGGIGLATALVGVLALIPTVATTTEAGDRGAGLMPSARDSQPAIPLQIARTAPRRTNAQAEPEEQGRQTAEEQPVDPSSHDRKSDRSGNSEARSPQAESVGEPAGHGSGQSQTPQRQDQGLEPAVHGTQSASSKGDSDLTSAGGEQSAGREPGKAGFTGGAVSGHSTDNPQSSPDFGTPSERQKYMQQMLDQGQVPDAYRDVVRGYFEGS